MELKDKLSVLEQMMAIYDRCVGQFDLACQKYCAHCCTANVTMTTLEGFWIMSHLERTGGTACLEPLTRQAHPDRFVPRITINRMADVCARGGDPPDEQPNPEAGPCPILTDQACAFYAVRPFGCRCMVSARNCAVSGVAEMDPFILTLNDIFLQHLEHIDARGYTGNFVDVIRFFQSDENRSNYAAGRPGRTIDGLLANQPVFVLMIPPRHRDRIQPVLEQIRRIRV
jgi:hypothetical protein